MYSQKEDPDFPRHILKKIDKDNQTSFNKRYLKELVMLSGKIDISCKKAASNAMRTFSINLLEEGYKIAKNSGSNDINIEQYLDPLSEKKISAEIIHQSNINFLNKIKEFQNLKYSCLLCDVGTEFKCHCFHIILANSKDSKLNILFETYDDDSFDSNFYSKCFRDIFNKMVDNHILICSITMDNLPAQIRR